jgi:hypothetical protein
MGQPLRLKAGGQPLSQRPVPELAQDEEPEVRQDVKAKLTIKPSSRFQFVLQVSGMNAQRPLVLDLTDDCHRDAEDDDDDDGRNDRALEIASAGLGAPQQPVPRAFQADLSLA